MKAAAAQRERSPTVSRRRGNFGAFRPSRSLPISTAIVAGSSVEPSANQPAAARSSWLARVVRYAKAVPFLSLHVACFAVLFTGVHTFDVVLCVMLYFIRMFGITA